MANSWLTFLKEYRKAHPSLSMKMAMKQGAVEWRKKKAGKGKKEEKPKKRKTKKKKKT